jgi:hypothetical protein
MKHILFCFISFIGLLLSTPTIAQPADEVTGAYVDRPGDLYVIKNKNIFYKYDTAGTLLNM